MIGFVRTKTFLKEVMEQGVKSIFLQQSVQQRGKEDFN